LRAAPVTVLASLVVGTCLVGACAEASVTQEPPSSSAVGGSGGAATGGAASTVSTGGADMITPQACDDGEFAIGFDEDGVLECDTIDSTVAGAVGEGCALYFGWRDSCDECTAAPNKWGHVNTTNCVVGAGGDNTCAETELGDDTVQLLGINTDGNVNGDDKFSIGLHCANHGESAEPGPCLPGEFVAGVNGDFVECRHAQISVLSYVRNHCFIYWGWRDNCEGCVDPPSEWGRTQFASCHNGGGDDNSCYTPFLGGQWVPQFGLSTDGDVDGNDTFYLGMTCDDGESDVTTSFGSCPPDKLMVGIQSDGSLQCARPDPVVAPRVRDSCALYFGWLDSCDGCTDPPDKWGKVSPSGCTLGAGADSSCTDLSLDNVALTMLALNTDGNVNGDDKFHVAFQCGDPAVDPPR